MVRRAQEMRIAAQSMTEVAFRLAEPENLAQDRIMMVGQAVRREVAAMGEGIERTLARAVELETLVHTEVNQIERSYSENAARIRALVDGLGSEREAVVTHAERVRASITGAHETLRDEIGSASDIIRDSILNASTKLSMTITNSGDTLIDRINESGMNLFDSMDIARRFHHRSPDHLRRGLRQPARHAHRQADRQHRQPDPVADRPARRPHFGHGFAARRRGTAR